MCGNRFIRLPILPQREELFNFKSVVGQQTFFEMTSNSGKLSQCFKSNGEFLTQAAQFESTLKGIFQQSFQKIRGKKRKSCKSEVEELLEQRKRLKVSIENTPNYEAKNELISSTFDIWR